MKYDVTTRIVCRRPSDDRFVSETEGNTPYLSMQQLTDHLNIDQMISFSKWLLEEIQERHVSIGDDQHTFPPSRTR